MSVNLSIKAVPDLTAERLRARAERNHRSLQGELMAIIEHVVAEESSNGMLARGQGSGGGKTIEAIAAAHRLRFPKPITSGPLAVDIIRTDRNSR
jgi:plasmid stability protein